MSICFSLYIIRPRLLSTLYPYTTLFRSGVHVVGSSIASRDTSRHYLRGSGSQMPRSVSGMGGMSSLSDERAEVRSDRKSTRLNSSHVAISYAVFCLKKKNKQSYYTSKS